MFCRFESYRTVIHLWQSLANRPVQVQPPRTVHGEGLYAFTKSLCLSMDELRGQDAHQGSFMLVSERVGSHSEKASETSKHHWASGRNRGWMEKEATMHESTGAEVDG